MKPLGGSIHNFEIRIAAKLDHRWLCISFFFTFPLSFAQWYQYSADDNHLGVKRLRVIAGAPPLPEKHFPWVWQLEQNKRLLFTSRSASHNTQLTACSSLIHSQDLGVSPIRDTHTAFYPLWRNICEKDVSKVLLGRWKNTENNLPMLHGDVVRAVMIIL